MEEGARRKSGTKRDRRVFRAALALLCPEHLLVDEDMNVLSTGSKTAEALRRAFENNPVPTNLHQGGGRWQTRRGGVGGEWDPADASLLDGARKEESGAVVLSFGAVGVRMEGDWKIIPVAPWRCFAMETVRVLPKQRDLPEEQLGGGSATKYVRFCPSARPLESPRNPSIRPNMSLDLRDVPRADDLLTPRSPSPTSHSPGTHHRQSLLRKFFGISSHPSPAATAASREAGVGVRRENSSSSSKSKGSVGADGESLFTAGSIPRSLAQTLSIGSPRSPPLRADETHRVLADLLLKDAARGYPVTLSVLQVVCDTNGSSSPTQAMLLKASLRFFRRMRGAESSCELFCFAVAKEIGEEKESRSVLRQDSLATRLWLAFCESFGGNYAREIVSKIEQTMRLASPRQRDQDDRILDEAVAAVENTPVPPEIAFALRVVGQIVLCSRFEKLILPITANLLFLRFLLPAVLLPQRIGMMDLLRTPERQALAVRLTKRMQILVSEVEDPSSSKEYEAFAAAKPAAMRPSEDDRLRLFLSGLCCQQHPVALNLSSRRLSSEIQECVALLHDHGHFLDAFRDVVASRSEALFRKARTDDFLSEFLRHVVVASLSGPSFANAGMPL